jgi:hypothetical protein
MEPILKTRFPISDDANKFPITPLARAIMAAAQNIVFSFLLK